MAGYIWEFFGYRADDNSRAATDAARDNYCPFVQKKCEKTLNDGLTSGVCTIKPIKTAPVICCPIRLYAQNYKILHDVSDLAFWPGLPLIPGKDAVAHAFNTAGHVVAVFGKDWGGELRLPQKDGLGGYFVDWVLALLGPDGVLIEFVAVEVQTIDTTGNYRNGRDALLEITRTSEKTTAGLNWENVSKRILPQLIYKGQVLQREELCKKGLFFICPDQVYEKTMGRLGGQAGLLRYALQPASITFLSYQHKDQLPPYGDLLDLVVATTHSTTVYKVQEAFNNVALPAENVYKNAILNALKP